MIVGFLYVVIMMADTPIAPTNTISATPLTDGYCSLLRVDADPQLLALQSRVRELAGGIGEYTEPAELHITLCYATGGKPTQWQAETVAWRDALSFIVDGVGVFDTPDGFAVYAAVRKTSELAALQADQCQQALADGFTLSPHSIDYTPHITLAYLPQAIAPFEVAAFPMMATKIELSNPDHDAVALMTLKSAQSTSDRLIAFGGAIKSIGEDRVGGYLARWGSPQEKDLQREYFTKATDFVLDWYTERPSLYHHGLDGNLKHVKVGTIDTVKADDVGLWIEAQLDMRNRYVNAVRSLVDKGVLQWSSGAYPHLVEIEPDGFIKRWPLVEGSLTPTPAEPRYATSVISIKSLATLPRIELTEEPTVKGSDVPTVAASQIVPVSIPDNTSTKDVTMDDQMLAQVINAILQQVGATATPEQMPALLAAAQEACKGTDYAPDGQPTPEAAQEATMKAINDAAFLAKLTNGIKSAISTLDAKNAAVKAAQQANINSAVANAMKSAPAISQTPNAGRQQITEVHDMRYDDLEPQAAIFAVNTLKSAGKPISESLARAAATKVFRAADTGNQTYTAVKSVIGLKADEIMATNLSAGGLEWAGVAYERRMWEKVRATVIYMQLLEMGVFQAQVKDGENSVKIPSQGSDPTWYSLAEINDEDSTERPGTTFKTSRPTTAVRTLTPGFLGAKATYSGIMDEDSLIQMAPFLNDVMEKSAQEVVEYVMFNGDTVTTASTNLNLIDGTPSVDAKGRGPSYLSFDGILKLPIITTTALSRDCGSVFDEDDFLNTFKLLPKADRQNRSRLMYVVDSDTIAAAMQIPSLKTRDVFVNASLENGVLPSIYQIKVVESAQIPLANSAGKVPAAGGTLGRIACVRPDQWAIAWKRQITTKTAEDIEADAHIIVSSLRFGMTYRLATTGAAVTYNVPV